jgi:hypothetical protein
MKTPWQNLQGPAKWLVLFATILLVASGLCGLQLLMVNSNMYAPNWIGNVFLILGFVEIIAIVISTIGGLVALLFWIFHRIAASAQDSNEQ